MVPGIERLPRSPDASTRQRNGRCLKSIFTHLFVFALGMLSVINFNLHKHIGSLGDMNSDGSRKGNGRNLANGRQNFFGHGKPRSSLSSKQTTLPNFSKKDFVSKPAKASNTEVDARLQVERPFMESASRTIIDSIYDVERKYVPSNECNAWGGTKFMEELSQSSKCLVEGGTSTIESFRNEAMDVYFAENVAVLVSMPSAYENEDQRAPNFSLEVDGQLVPNLKQRLSGKEKDSVVAKMGKNIKERKGIPECTEYIEYPVMLIDSGVDTWNWWFFLQIILHHYIAVGLVQPHLMGDYHDDALRVMLTSNDNAYSRSNVDAFEFIFSDRRGRDARQLWHMGEDANLASTHGNKEQRFCFRKLLWAPGGGGGGELLVNHAHGHSNCFSSIIYSYAAYIKAAMHIPTLPRPEKPRIVWVGRDTTKAANPSTWQQRRIINNQDQVIMYLQKKYEAKGIEFIIADFYGKKKDTPFQEQVLFVSKANIMIGMHGAGLNMFHFMPFNSVVVEIHHGTQAQKNSANFVNHIREGAYLPLKAIMKAGRKLDEKPVWDKLEQAIQKWHDLGKQ